MEVDEPKENDKEKDYMEEIPGTPSEIYIKFRSPKYAPRYDLLNFLPDNTFFKSIESKKVYIEKYRDEEMEAAHQLGLVIPNEDHETRIERMKEAKYKSHNLYKDPIKFAAGVGSTKQEYKALPIEQNVNKFVVLVRNDTETWEAHPLDNIYEMKYSRNVKEVYEGADIGNTNKIFEDLIKRFNPEPEEKVKKVKKHKKVVMETDDLQFEHDAAEDDENSEKTAEYDSLGSSKSSVGVISDGDDDDDEYGDGDVVWKEKSAEYGESSDSNFKAFDNFDAGPFENS